MPLSNFWNLMTSCLCLSAQHISTNIYWYHRRKVAYLYVACLLHTILRTLTCSDSTNIRQAPTKNVGCWIASELPSSSFSHSAMKQATSSTQWPSRVFYMSAVCRETPPVLGPYCTSTGSRAAHSKHGARTACQRKPWSAGRCSVPEQWAQTVKMQHGRQGKSTAGRDKWWGHHTSKRWKE